MFIKKVQIWCLDLFFTFNSVATFLSTNKGYILMVKCLSNYKISPLQY